MGWVSGIALYFLIWWVVLFLMLPIGTRSQLEEEDITLGTDHGAPTSPNIGRKLIFTTLLTTAVFAAYYLVTVKLGFGLDDIPRIVPRYQRPLE